MALEEVCCWSNKTVNKTELSTRNGVLLWQAWPRCLFGETWHPLLFEHRVFIFLSFGSLSNFLCCSVICLRKLFYLLPPNRCLCLPILCWNSRFSLRHPHIHTSLPKKVSRKGTEGTCQIHFLTSCCLHLRSGDFWIACHHISGQNSLSVPQQPKNETCGMKSICKRMGTLIASVFGRFPVLEGRVEERMILGYVLIYTSIRSHLLNGLPQPVLF